MTDDPSSTPRKETGSWLVAAIVVLVIGVVGVGIYVFTRIFTMVDCGWDASVQTWVDENGNGIWDAGEPPLENVKIYVDSSLNNQPDSDYPESKSDWNGKGRISIFLAGCPKIQFEVYTEPPPGYRLMTNEYITVQDPYQESGRSYSFGFARLPGFPTPTPYVPGLTCKTYHQSAAKIVTAPDGSVWALDWDGVARYDPAQDGWQAFEAREGSSFSGDHIALGTDGVIWLTDRLMRAARFQDSTWTYYEGDDNLLVRSAPSIGATPNGEVWFINARLSNRLASFDPKAGSWKLYCGGTENACRGEDVLVKASTDGSIWLAAFDDPAKLVPSEQSDSLNWKVYRQHTFLRGTIRPMPIRDGWILDAEIAPDGTIWIAYTFGLAHLDPATEEWQVYDETTTNGALSDWPNDLAIAPDGSIWIASGHPHPLAFHLVAAHGAEQDMWRAYDPRDGIPDIYQIGCVTVSPDGAVWFGVDDTIARCVPIDHR